MRFRFFDENQVERWSIFLDVEPSGMKTQKLDNHINPQYSRRSALEAGVERISL